MRTTLIASAITAILLSSLFVSSAQLTVAVNTGGVVGQTGQPALPKEFDVRGPDGVPKGTALRAPSAAQLAA
ncbi:MAG: hypothetical protein H0T60_06935, partial [Acidobacteria bacterium]|nr:hypothetical protein [Acidobacteriota bacterium]